MRTTSNSLQKFEILFIKLGESIEDYFSRTLAIANKMCIHNEKIEDVAMVEKIVIMAPKFMFVVCSIEESKDLDELLIVEL